MFLRVLFFGPRLAQHPQHAFLVGERKDFVVGEPAQVVGFLAEDGFLIRFGDDEKTHVVMLVGIVDERSIGPPPRGDEMHVEIQGHKLTFNRGKRKPGETGFFARFAERDLGDFRFAVGVSPRLEPAIELRMMHEQAARAVVRQDPGRAGDMAGAAGPLEAVGVFGGERANPRGNGCFVGITQGVTVEQREKWLAVHGRILQENAEKAEFSKEIKTKIWERSSVLIIASKFLVMNMN